ncbi:hypothetical protein ACHAXR_003745 [Thalassiosira sp. AJA248-18]
MSWLRIAASASQRVYSNLVPSSSRADGRRHTFLMRDCSRMEVRDRCISWGRVMLLLSWLKSCDYIRRSLRPSLQGHLPRRPSLRLLLLRLQHRNRLRLQSQGSHASMVNKRVLIVDDVITAGTAIRESHTLLSAIEGARPVGVAIELDRAEKRSLEDPLSAVQAVARDLDIPVLQEYLRLSPEYDEDVLKVVTEYRSRYGA